MNIKQYNSYLNNLSLFSFFILSGCSDIVLINSKGQIGLEQRSLILTSIGLMLIVVIPVIIMAFAFSIKYRVSNSGKTTYNPNFYHSNKIEIVVWSISILIIAFLATLTWKSTHALDPRKPIASKTKNITIQAIATDWKWLFIYPEQNIATVNEIAFPAKVPIRFEITSNSVMNSFFIPQLGSQIYAMAGMNTILYLIANEPGNYKGISSNFSGRGFSGMKFTAIATPDQAMFKKWIKKVKSSTETLSTIEDYEQLAAPSEDNPVKYFSKVKIGLYKNILDKFMSSKSFKYNHNTK